MRVDNRKARSLWQRVRNPSIARVEVVLFLFVWLAYGAAINSDNLVKFNLQQIGVEAIVERHQFYLEGSEVPELQPLGDVFLYQGHKYAAKQPCQFIAGAPVAPGFRPGARRLGWATRDDPVGACRIAAGSGRDDLNARLLHGDSVRALFSLAAALEVDAVLFWRASDWLAPALYL